MAVVEVGPRLVAIRRAEDLIRRLAAMRTLNELKDHGRELVVEARAVVEELDATNRDRMAR